MRMPPAAFTTRKAASYSQPSIALTSAALR
jgi:hypothetical protein